MAWGYPGQNIAMVRGEITIKRYKVVLFTVVFLIQFVYILYVLVGNEGCCAVAKRCQDVAETRFEEIKRKCKETERYAKKGYDSANRWRRSAMQCISRLAEIRSGEGGN